MLRKLFFSELIVFPFKQKVEELHSIFAGFNFVTNILYSLLIPSKIYISSEYLKNQGQVFVVFDMVAMIRLCFV